MFKYTLNKQRRKAMFPAVFYGRESIDRAWENELQFLKDCGVKDMSDGFRILNALRRFKYAISPTRLNHVNIGGFLLPIDQFEEEVYDVREKQP